MKNSALNKRINDWEKLAFKSYRLITSHFLDESTLADVMTSHKINELWISGGHEFARRVIIGFNGDPSSRIVCLVSKINTKFNQIAHRDVYGGLMSLNLSSDVLGDILIFDDKICIYALAENAKDIIENLTQIHRLKVEFSISETHFTQAQSYKAFEGIVSSTRVDAIVAHIAKISREEAKNLISQKKVKINHHYIEESKILCNNGDIISIQGVGRFKFDNIIKQTKKERLLIAYRQYQ